MSLIIGIDTGGTYTDAVIYDTLAHKVLCRGKTPTTRRDLAEGIGRALDALPKELLAQAQSAALSTTLATNACVENRGGRARLLLQGVSEKTLRFVEADKKYGLRYDDVLCVPVKSSFDGKVAQQPDWDALLGEHGEFFADAQAIAVAEVNAIHNGAVIENGAREALTKRFNVPLIAGSELAGGLNVMERGATALLNARLLPVIDQFMDAVHRAFNERGITAQTFTVRSDGSLMNDAAVKRHPVQTILSGPAASVLGGMALAEARDCLIIDMGGTTTDISVVRGGLPVMSGGISIGGWRTQIKGVYIDTFGLGGDTRLYISDSRLCLDTRRVEPLCEAAARWPQVRDKLSELIEKRRVHTLPIYEFLYLTRMPDEPKRYTPSELELLEKLSGGPLMIGGEELDMYSLDSARLEEEGIVMRCGLTPADVMHVVGDFDAFDAEAAKLAVRYFVRALPDYGDDDIGVKAFCRDVYNLVKRRMFENILRVLLTERYGAELVSGVGTELDALISRQWRMRGEHTDDALFDLKFDVRAQLIGIGAPTHIFLPDVAKALGAECVLPEWGEVANAVGAAVAEIDARTEVEIRTLFEGGGIVGFSVFAAGSAEVFDEYDDAVGAAKQKAAQLAESEARSRGALGALTVDVDVSRHMASVRDGVQVDLGTVVTARAYSVAE